MFKFLNNIRCWSLAKKIRGLFGSSYRIIHIQVLKPSLKLLANISSVCWYTTVITIRFLIGFALFLAVVASCLFFTQSGSEFLLDQLKKANEDVKFDYVSGHFGHGFVLENVAITVPDVLVFEAQKLELDYSLMSILQGRFKILNIGVINSMLILGKKPEEMPDIVQFLMARLAEVKAFEYNDEAKVLTRVRASTIDKTVSLAPRSWGSVFKDNVPTVNVASLDTEYLGAPSQNASLGLNATGNAILVPNKQGENVEHKDIHNLEALDQKVSQTSLVKPHSRGTVAVIDEELYNLQVKNALTYAPKLSELTLEGVMQNGGLDFVYPENHHDTKLGKTNRLYKIYEQADKISLPFAFDIASVRVHNFLYFSDVIDVALSDATISAVLEGNRITLTQGEVSYIDILLHNERFIDEPNTQELDPLLKSKPLKTPFVRESLLQNVAMLPTVILPFDSVVKKLDMHYVRYHQDGYDTGVMYGRLIGSFKGPKIEVQELSIDHELGHAELTDSHIYLSRYYPMQVNLSAWSANTNYEGMLKSHTLKAQGTGDLVDLYVTANISGTKDVKDEIALKARLGTITPHLPFVAKVLLKNIKYPLQNHRFTIDTLELDTRGTLEAVSLAVKGNGAQAKPYPKMNLSLSGTSNFELASLKEFFVWVPRSSRTNAKSNLALKDDELKLEGMFSWHKGILGHGKISAQAHDLTIYLPQISGALNLGTTFKASFFNSKDWALDVNSLLANGHYLGSKLQLNAERITLNQDFAGEIKHFNLMSGVDNRITIDGTMHNTLMLKGYIALNKLDSLWPGLGGNVNGELIVGGTYGSPRANLKLESKRLVFENNHVRDVKFNSSIVTKDFHITALELVLSTARIAIERETYAQATKLSIHGNEREHELNVEAQTQFGDAHLVVKGGFNAALTQYSGVLNTLNYRHPDVAVSLSKGGNFKLDLTRGLTVSSDTTFFTVNGNEVLLSPFVFNGADAKGGLKANQFDLMQFSNVLPCNLIFSQPLNLEVDFAYTLGKPQANIEIFMPEGEITYNRNLLRYQLIKARASLKDDKLQTQVLGDLGLQGKVEALVNLGALSSSKNLSGSFSVEQLDLGVVSVFSPAVSSSNGFLQGALTFKGTVEKPEIYGNLQVNDMSLTTVVDLGTVEHINTLISFMGTQSKVHSSFSLHEHQGSVDGLVSWAENLTAKLNLKTERLPVSLMGYGLGEIELDVNADYAEDLASVQGVVKIPKAEVKIKQLPTSSVAVSSDVVKVDKADNGAFIIDRQKALPINLNLTLTVGPDFNISAMGLKTGVQGDIKISQKPNSFMIAKGTIFLNNGRFKAYGQNLLIEKGRISFVGALENPNIEVRAIRDPHTMENENVTVGLMVTGNAKVPQLKLFSEPQMAQSEMLSYLMRGRGLEQSTEENSDMSTQLLLGVGLMQTSGYIGELVENIGINDFSLDSKGEGDDTSVEVSGYIMPKVQVAYGYGIYNALSEFRVRYEMFPRFFLEYVSSLEQAVDAIYKFEF